MDADGDLVLRVGSELGNAQEFRVCSAAMRRASPVWKSMLFDKPWPIRMLLAIVHGKFDHVRSTLTLDELRDILVVTDKYDLLPVIRPWPNTWMLAVHSQPRNGRERILKLHVAWELGCEEVVSSELDPFVFNYAILKHGSETRVSYKGGEPVSFDGHFLPEDLLETVAELRLFLIQPLLDFYHGEIKRRTQLGISATCCVVGSAPGQRKLCDAVILGGIYRTHKILEKDYLAEDASDILGSANDLMFFLWGLFRELPCLEDHTQCSPVKRYNVLEAQIKADGRWTNVLRPHHRERMEAQRKKAGLDC
ncbi:hypothetical protein C8A00DRAFT_46600 [Chaetomidium leptoderma]|uniref:BTB domain-containing protein n=1 Tax=Chaetomidium leptoderma TaxID=669021 RepID=A0AAN6VEK3_9PEZI|nr:hypothetical protein C8A00DRAFT_46600 [Chaetomidium leptoderma]